MKNQHQPGQDDESVPQQQADDERATVVPDGPGPHDVPDEEVIRETLPEKTPGERPGQ